MTQKITENKTKGDEFEVICLECNRETNHKVLLSINNYFKSDDNHQCYVDGATEYQIIRCQGCLNISFRSESWFSEDYGPEAGYNKRIILYPKRSINTLTCRDFYNVPPNIHGIYQEIIDSFNNKLCILCAAGLRALIEGICADKNVKSGEVPKVTESGKIEFKKKKNIEGKIYGLSDRGILTKSDATILHEHRYLGNKALHELTKPSNDNLQIAIEIIEHVLEAIYEFPAKAREFKKRNKKSN